MNPEIKAFNLCKTESQIWSPHITRSIPTHGTQGHRSIATCRHHQYTGEPRLSSTTAQCLSEEWASEWALSSLVNSSSKQMKRENISKRAEVNVEKNKVPIVITEFKNIGITLKVRSRLHWRRSRSKARGQTSRKPRGSWQRYITEPGKSNIIFIVGSQDDSFE